MPPNPILPAACASQTCTRLSALSSVSGLVTFIDRNWVGSQNHSAVTVTTPPATPSPNALRQPSTWPSQDAIGTPITVGTVRPPITCATAFARFCGPIKCVATRAATPKYAPCGNPATNRAIISVWYDGANTLARLPSVNTAIRVSSSVLRGTRAASAAMSGAPITTPSAYAEITWPAVGSLMPRLDAMSGSSPIATNSVVPMPNPPTASASTASQRTAGPGATTEMGRVGRSSEVGMMQPTVERLLTHRNRLRYLKY